MMPLEDVHVLDLSRLVPGPFCTMLLGDMGADILQIEPPPSGIGDVQRFITGLLKIDKKLVILLDIEGLFSDDEQLTLTEAAKAASK